MDRREADAMLEQAELAPCMEGGLREMKELEEACLDAGIPAVIGMEGCAKPNCSPKAQIAPEMMPSSGGSSVNGRTSCE